MIYEYYKIICHIAKKLPTGLYDPKAVEKLEREKQELKETPHCDFVGRALEGADCVYYLLNIGCGLGRVIPKMIGWSEWRLMRCYRADCVCIMGAARMGLGRPGCCGGILGNMGWCLFRPGMVMLLRA